MSRSRDIPTPPRIHAKSIPAGAGRIDPPDEGADYVSIHFSDYNVKQCEIKKLDAARARGVLDDLRKAGSASITGLYSAGVEVKPVDGSNDYARLYKGLNPDIQLMEIVSASTARVICYVVESRLYVRTILSTHLETTKNRRGLKRSRKKGR